MPPDGPNRLLVPMEGSAPLVKWNDRQLTAIAHSTAALHTNTFATFKKVDYKSYTVLKGDNLWKIARQFDTDLEALTTWNSIDSKSKPLQPGDKLWYAQIDDESTRHARLIRYRVVTSDTVPSVSRKFNTRFAELKKWNKSLRYSPVSYTHLTLPTICSV